MRIALPLCLFLSVVAAGAQEPDSTPPVIRASLGWPAISGDGWFGVELRLAAGSSNSPLRFGVPALELGSFLSSTDPDMKLDAIHAWAGCEMSRTGPFSAMVFTGLGGASWIEKGNLLHPEYMWGEYEGVKRSGLSAILGMDLGVSLGGTWGSP